MKQGMALTATAGPEAARGWTHYHLRDEKGKTMYFGDYQPDSLGANIFRKYGVTEADMEAARTEAKRTGGLPLHAR